MFEYIKDAQIKDQKGISKSNIKGWHSNDFDLKDEFKKIYKLHIAINKTSNDRYELGG